MRLTTSLWTVLAVLAPAGTYGLAAPAPGGRGPSSGSAVGSRRALNRDWYARRAAGDPSARQRKPGSRAKKSERAADLLYQIVSIDPSIVFPGLSGSTLDAAAEAMLAECHVAADPSPSLAPQGAVALAADTPSKEAGTPRARGPPGVMWGSCSTGPVLCSRLVSAGLLSPTPIQEAAYDSIAKGGNALLLAQTGAGKTLAFVLPLLSRLRRDQPYSVLFISPSLELASQLQASVDLLWPPAPLVAGGKPVSALRVIHPPEAVSSAGDASNFGRASGWVGEHLLSQLDGSALIAGTPHTLRMLFDAAAEAVGTPQATPRGRGVARGRGGSGGRGRGGGGSDRRAPGGWSGSDRIEPPSDRYNRGGAWDGDGRFGSDRFGRGGARDSDRQGAWDSGSQYERDGFNRGGDRDNGGRYAGGDDGSRFGGSAAWSSSPAADVHSSRWESLDPKVIAAARALRRSLQAIVLDEADQLLGSEALATAQAARRARGGELLTGKERAIEKRATAPSACELLLREMPRDPAEMQFIAASASASRTLRRQLLPLVGGVSIDKAVPLIQVREGGGEAVNGKGKGKGTGAPLAGRMPESIRHMYALWRPAARGVIQGGAGLALTVGEGGVGDESAEEGDGGEIAEGGAGGDSAEGGLGGGTAEGETGHETVDGGVVAVATEGGEATLWRQTETMVPGQTELSAETEMAQGAMPAGGRDGRFGCESATDVALGQDGSGFSVGVVGESEDRLGNGELSSARMLGENEDGLRAGVEEGEGVGAEEAEAEEGADADESEEGVDEEGAEVDRKAEEAERQSHERCVAALEAMLKAIRPLPPAPAILFAERGPGVAKTAAALRGLGMRHVVTLPLQSEGGDASSLEVARKELSCVDADASVSKVVTAGSMLREDAAQDASSDQPEPVPSSPPLEPLRLAADGATQGLEQAAATHGRGHATWENTPIYVASERYGRGLDLGLGYVLLLSPPSSAAGYLHLAGRTGRQGAAGTVVTLLSRQQAPRLASFARLLGVGLRRLLDSEKRCEE